MDIYEKVKSKYKKRRALAVGIISAGVFATILTVIFIFVKTIDPIPAWNRYHFWAAGLVAVLITSGAIMFVSSNAALKDIEKTIDRLHPDERELAIQEKSRAKTLRIYYMIIFPVFFTAASVLLMAEVIDFIAWILIVASFLALLVTLALVRRNEYKKH